MGKPFATELNALPRTYSWAFEQEIDDLARSIRLLSDLPLLAVGSGGSFTASHLVCELHRLYTGNAAQALTPLQLTHSSTSLRGMGVVVPTAGGKNPDVLGCFRHVIHQEPRRALIWCATPGSRISSAASEFPFVDIHEYGLPSGKDSFLAVNSLLAFFILMSRAYARVHGQQGVLPETFDQIDLDNWDEIEQIDQRCEPLWSKETLLVLHGPSTLAAAIDIESKLTEAALASVQLADFRHFAHGRHHWLAKRATSSSILAIVTDNDREIADPLLRLIPSGIPKLYLDTHSSGLLAILTALLRGFFFTASAGRFRQIDPGDPGVPTFGRRIYHLNAYRKITKTPDDETIAIARKTNSGPATLTKTSSTFAWKEAYRSIQNLLAEASFGGLVVDYDGTLCEEKERFGQLPSDIADQIIRLATANLIIGVATGRGKSARETLRQALPKKLWKRVVVGYYNGAETSTLDDDMCPSAHHQIQDSLISIAEILRGDPVLANSAKLEFKSSQITITPLDSTPPTTLWTYVNTLLVSLPDTGARVLRSGHSVDIIAAGVTKLAVLHKVLELSGRPSAPVLRIGDRGRWPGNDFALLCSPFGLSVDEVSPDPRGGWNLARAGCRGRQATLDYLLSLHLEDGTMRWQPASATSAGKKR
jgi:hydroxymethylpyrimidine pyrophosphatase-like HAD family hydrolase